MSPRRTASVSRYVNAPVSIDRQERLSSGTDTGKNVCKAMVKTGIVWPDFGVGSLSLNRAVFKMPNEKEVEGYLAQPHCSQFVMYLDNNLTCMGIDTGYGVIPPVTIRACQRVAKALDKELGHTEAKELAYNLYQRAPSVDATRGSMYRVIEAMVRKSQG